MEYLGSTIAIEKTHRYPKILNFDLVKFICYLFILVETKAMVQIKRNIYIYSLKDLNKKKSLKLGILFQNSL